jgi:amidase
VAAGVRRAAGALEDAGYVVEELEPPHVAGAAQVWAQLISVQLRKMEPMVRDLMSEPAREFLDRALEILPAVDLALHATAALRRDGLLRAWSEFLEERPVVVAPLSTSRPFAPNADLEPDRGAALLAGMRMTVAVSILGLPSVAVPVGTAEGLPQVVQVIAARRREHSCLAAAEAIEERLGVVTPVDPRSR